MDRPRSVAVLPAAFASDEPVQFGLPATGVVECFRDMSRSAHAFQSALQSLVPSGVAACVDWAPETVDFDYAEEAQCVEGSVIQRQREFLGGRHCLRAALGELGMRPVAIPNNAHRVPMWPEGVVASISHSRGLCAAVAAQADQFTCLGLDVEQVDRLRPASLKRVMHPDEQVREGDALSTGTLFFSAKEAFYKAQYACFAESPGFHDLQLKLHADNQRLAVVATSGMSSKLSIAAKQMEFRYAMVEGVVMVLCSLRASEA